MVGLTLVPNLRLHSLVVLAPSHGRQPDWRLSVIPAQPQFRVIHNQQDLIYLPGESSYCAKSEAALADCALQVRCQFGCPQPLPGSVVTAIVCCAPGLGGLPLRLPPVSLASAGLHQLSTPGIRAGTQRSRWHQTSVPAAAADGLPSLLTSFGGPSPGRRRFRVHTL